MLTARKTSVRRNSLFISPNDVVVQLGDVEMRTFTRSTMSSILLGQWRDGERCIRGGDCVECENFEKAYEEFRRKYD